jgi:hypothetical protein
VQGIDQNLRLNRALWLLADGMRRQTREAAIEQWRGERHWRAGDAAS